MKKSQRRMTGGAAIIVALAVVVSLAGLATAGEDESPLVGSWTLTITMGGKDFDVIVVVNPDLTVYFARLPAPGPIGLDIHSRVGDAGVGLSEARLRDTEGVFGRSAQSLVISPR